MSSFSTTRLAFLSLLIASSAWAADKTAYIRTDCANDGTGASSSCAASGGAAGAWNTCAHAVTGELLANADITGMGNLILDAAGTAADGQCTIDGFTTNSTHVVRLMTVGANRPIVAPWIDATKYRLVTSTNGVGALEIRDQYVEVDGIQASHTGNGSGSYAGIAAQTSGALSLKITNSIMQIADCAGGGGGGCSALLFFPNVANTRLIAANNIGIALGTGGTSEAMNLRAGGNNAGEILIVYNNGAYGGDYGLRFDGNGSGLTLRVKNNWMQSNGTGFFISGAFGTYTHNNNLTEDTTSPDNTYDSMAISFTNEGTQDFTLQSGDATAKGNGADLSADAFYAFSTDLQGHTRAAPWDIGPLQYTAATASAKRALLLGVGP